MYPHDLREYCKRPSTPKRNDSLHKRLQQGEDTRKQLILDNTPLVVWHVNKYLEKHQHLESHRDDLVSEGIIRLIKCVDTMKEKYPGNITRFLSLNIFYAVRRAGAKIVCDSSIEDVSDEDLLIENQDIALIDLEDAILTHCDSERDKQIVEMRLSGDGFVDIAWELGLSRSHVCRLFNEFAEKAWRAVK